MIRILTIIRHRLIIAPINFKTILLDNNSPKIFITKDTPNELRVVKVIAYKRLFTNYIFL
jgi:hypothetical protein